MKMFFLYFSFSISNVKISSCLLKFGYVKRYLLLYDLLSVSWMIKEFIFNSNIFEERTTVIELDLIEYFFLKKKRNTKTKSNFFNNQIV